MIRPASASPGRHEKTKKSIVFSSFPLCLLGVFLYFQTETQSLKPMSPNFFLHISIFFLPIPNFFLHIWCQENDWILLACFSLQNAQSRPHQSSPHLDFKTLSWNKIFESFAWWWCNPIDADDDGDVTPVPHLQSTGTSGAKDGDLGLIYVNASNGLARAQGVRPGALLSNVGHGGVRGRGFEGIGAGGMGHFYYDLFTLIHWF